MPFCLRFRQFAHHPPKNVAQGGLFGGTACASRSLIQFGDFFQTLGRARAGGFGRLFSDFSGFWARRPREAPVNGQRHTLNATEENHVTCGGLSLSSADFRLLLLFWESQCLEDVCLMEIAVNHREDPGALKHHAMICPIVSWSWIPCSQGTKESLGQVVVVISSHFLPSITDRKTLSVNHFLQSLDQTTTREYSKPINLICFSGPLPKTPCHSPIR